VAKIDSSTRGATLVDDELEDAYSRPASTSARSRLGRDFAVGSAVRAGQRRLEDEVLPRRRMPVRKGILPAWTRTRWGRIALIAGALTIIGGVIALVLAVIHFLDTDPRFRIEGASSIQIMGSSELTRDDLASVFGSDIGRNVFYVPLTQRRRELEQVPWVEHAVVMRILPNQLRVAVRERTPIAFVRIGDSVKLVDASGVVLNMPAALMAARHFSFPVVTGINPDEPLSTRAARMALYRRFIAELDGGGEKISSRLSEVDLSDAEDVRTTLPGKSSDLLLHFGDEKFLARYHIYQSHLAEWEQQYPRLAAVDLRYDGQVVLKMADGSPADGGLKAEGAALVTAPAAAPASAAKTATPKARIDKARTPATSAYRSRREAELRREEAIRRHAKRAAR
jgi:cell division protein FtsQ